LHPKPKHLNGIEASLSTNINVHGWSINAPPAPAWPARTYPVIRALVAYTSLTVDGYYTARPPRRAAAPGALAGVEHVLGHRLDPAHARFLLYADGWPSLWPLAFLDTPELRDQALTARLLAALVSFGDLEAAGIEPGDVYPVASSPHSGTAVAVRNHHDRAGEVLWFDGLAANVYSGFDGFFAAASERLVAVAGPLAGGRADGNDDEEDDR
jgi:hypothetical protein